MKTTKALYDELREKYHWLEFNESEELFIKECMLIYGEEIANEAHKFLVDDDIMYDCSDYLKEKINEDSRGNT